jgi:hypothetical protein
MNLLEDKSLAHLLEGELEQNILKSAYSTVFNYHDPLRGCVFALLIRELIRIIMERLSPDKEVLGASWCNGSDWTYQKEGKPFVTRRARYRFAITGTISDEQIKKHPDLDVSKTVDELSRLVNKLSKYAHISPGTTSPSVSMSNDFLSEVEDIFREYSDTLLNTKKKVKEIVYDLVHNEVNEHVMNAIPDELDALSTHTYVEGISIDELQDFDTSLATPLLSGSATAEIELNYGNEKEGVSMPDSYPVEFYVEIDPNTFGVSVESISVDTSKFYE